MDGGVPADDEVTSLTARGGDLAARLASRVYDDALERGVDRAG
jgi:hypothetical protein